MEVGGAVISLEHGDTTTGLEQLFHQPQRWDGMGEVFEDKADEYVIEGLRFERQRIQIRVQKFDIDSPAAATRSIARASDAVA